MASRNSSSDAQLEFVLEVPFPSQREASIALQALSPDQEPRRRGITKTLGASACTLSAKWTADEARILRVSVGSFLDHLALVIETMDVFGQPVLQ
ncbi:EKC/KEOPS complex subunit Lage3 [Electrophorus electricus]|uniref:L antigen family member 3 n=1 Tax=Electrophorus electricus TaxID=8005 RepID=A0A4W4E694_ELEEL|nr:EKC/KEOPS complex subunit Lage3 [Electrophorus electricus]